MSFELAKALQFVIHYGLHFVAPVIIAWIFFREHFKKATILMLATMLVDLDHFFAWPNVFVPDRCGIGFHPLHSYWAIVGYALMTLHPRTRIVGIGLLLHMFADLQDCWWIDYFSSSASDE